MSKSTLFQQTTEIFDSLVPLCEELLQTDDYPSKIDTYEKLELGIKQIEPTITKFRQRVAETDPDKQTYGPSMIKQIQDLNEKFEKLLEVFEDELKPTFDHILKLTKKREEEKKVKAQRLKELERVETIQRGKEQTENEEKHRRLKQQEYEETERLKKEAEAEMNLQVQQAEQETVKCREELLNEVHKCEAELLNGGYKLHCLEGLKLLAAKFSTNREFRSALDPLTELLTSIFRHPHQLHLRVLRLFNDQFMSSIGKHSGSTNILLSTGFRLKTQVESSAIIQRARQGLVEEEAASVVSSYPNDELYWVLEEPDSLLQHEEWLHWMEQIESVMSILMSVRDQLRHHIFLTPKEVIYQETMNQYVSI